MGAVDDFGGLRAVSVCLVDALQVERQKKNLTLVQLAEWGKCSVLSIYDFLSTGISDLTQEQFLDIIVTVGIEVDKLFPTVDVKGQTHLGACFEAIQEVFKAMNEAYAQMMAQQAAEESPIMVVP